MASLALDLRLALRNLVRQPRRTALSLTAVGVGIIALLLASGFIEWVFWAMREGSIQTDIGHVQVVRPGYIKGGAADPYGYLLPEEAPELELLRSLPARKTVAPRLAFNGLVSHGDATLSFIGEGIDPASESAFLRSRFIVEGQGMVADDPHSVLVGYGLAENLGVKVGDTIVMMATTRAGGINAVEGRVRGLFRPMEKAIGDTFIRVPIAMARELTRVSGSHAWVVLLDDTDLTQSTIAQLRARLPHDKYEIVPWIELSDFYVKTVALFSAQMNVVKLIVAIIIVLSISNTLMMSVMERTGEIGTSMALGVTRRRILRLFLSEGTLLGVIGGGIGVLAGAALAYGISAIGIPMPPPPGMATGYSGKILLTWGMAVEALALAVGTTLLASLYPAWKASHMIVVDALRQNR